MTAPARKHPARTRFPVLSPDEAAALIQHGQTVGFSGFTPAGATKVIPKAIARRAKAEHDAGRPFQIGVVTGASTGPSLDGELARANAISWRTPYQSDPDLRKRINSGETRRSGGERWRPARIPDVLAFSAKSSMRGAITGRRIVRRNEDPKAMGGSSPKRK